MNVDMLKKVNDLAKSLQQQGLAANMEDATKLASNMVGTNFNNAIGADSDAGNSNKVENENPKMNTVAKETSTTVENNSNNNFVNDVIKRLEILEKEVRGASMQSKNNFSFIKQIGNEIDKIYEKINQLNNLILNLRTNYNQVNQVKNNEQKSEPVQKEKKSENTGIDIRKYFYSGSDK